MELTKTRIQGGLYEGVLTADVEQPPELRVIYLERDMDGLEIQPDPALPKTWHLRLRLPDAVMTDGAHTVVIADINGNTLDSITVITGEPLSDDIRAEVDLLRAELDMLKKAFRRHCLETMND